MKSFVTILPVLGLALAQSQCGPSTVTEKIVDRITVTVSASPVADALATSSSHIPAHTHSHRPTHSHHPFPNGTFTNSTRFPTFTRVRPTTLETQVQTQSTVPTLSLLSSSSSVVSSAAVSSAAVSSTAVSSTASITASSTTIISSSAAAAPSASESAAAAGGTTSNEVSSAAVKGTATFYGGNVSGGHCSFTGYTLPSGIYGTAYGGTWDASQCGACVSVTGPNGKTVKAMIVDQCPECTVSHLDLFEDAFTQIGSKSAGIIDISYTTVDCGISSPIVLKNKSGTSKYWFSMQVVNSNVAVSKLEVSTDGGSSWKSTTRQAYNFFEISSGTGTDSVDVRVTSVGGNTVVVKGVSTADSASKTAGGNFSS